MLCVVCMFPPRASPTDWARDRGWSLSPLPSPRQHTDNIRPGQPPAWQSQHCNIEINTSYHLLDEWWMLPILSQSMKFAHQIKTNHSNYVLSRKEVAGIKIKTKCFAVTDGIEWRCTLNSCSSSDIHWTVNNNCAMLYLNCITFTSWAAVHCKVSAVIHLQAARISLYDGHHQAFSSLLLAGGSDTVSGTVIPCWYIRHTSHGIWATSRALNEPSPIFTAY